jgi:hypothetical protein
MIRRLLLLLSALAAALSTVTNWPVLLIGVAFYCATLIRALASPAVRRGGDADQTGAAIVLSVATGIVVLHAGGDPAVLWEVAGLLAALHALHLGRHVLRVLVFRRWRTVVDWRNVSVATPTPVRVEPVAGATLVAIPVWIAAPICAVYNAAPFVYLLLAILCLALVVITFVPISRALLRNLRMPSEPVRLAALAAALRESSPEVLVHFNARAQSAYAINEWMPTLAALNEKRRVVILTVDRQPWHFDTIESGAIPLVHLNGAEAIERFVELVPSLALALYPRNTSPNKNLLRVPGLFDAYVGHGESDKAEAANPATRAFDEIWVAGEAARDRFLGAGIGVHPDQLRITGRPQVAALLKLARDDRAGRPTAEGPRSRKSVVYAPTWEGYYAEDGYGSVLQLGGALIAALLARDDVSVSYVPHPALGTLNPEFALASRRIVARVGANGGATIIEGSQAERFAALAAADLLICDVSSDLVDFLALDRPYIVLNPSAADPASFVAANPSASAAATVVDRRSIDHVGEIVDRALSEDTVAGSRSALARRYLGDLSVPQLHRFLAEVDRCLAHIAATRPARTLPLEPETGTGTELENAE